MRAKTPSIDMSTYNKPANLPGFLVEVMCPRWGEFSRRYGGGCQEVPARVKAYGHHGVLFPPPTPTFQRTKRGPPAPTWPRNLGPRGPKLAIRVLLFLVFS